MYKTILSKLILLIFISSCNTQKPKERLSDLERLEEKVNYIGQNNDELNGQALAQIYCGTCHQIPSPTLLTKDIWKTNVLPNMAYRIGLKDPKASPYNGLSYEDQHRLKIANVYSDKPLIDSLNWDRIVEYYIENAPDSISILPTDSTSQTNLFSLENFYAEPSEYPLTTLVKYDSLNNKIWMGDAQNKLVGIGIQNKNFETLNFKSPVVHLEIDNENLTVLNIGPMTPSNLRSGTVQKYDFRTDSTYSVVNNLFRAVDVAYGDINNDGNEDMVVCGFGHDIGAFTMHLSDGQGSYINYTLANEPGAIKAEIDDFDGDGKNDIMVLFAQGGERLDVFLNKGKNRFDQKTLLAFPPVYGSLTFKITDLNHDSHFDLVYINGDNADYSNIPKNYHGLRFYINDGEMSFTETQFIPMHGAIDAIFDDFDQDGDVDAVAISFFPEYELSPNRSILYLENDGLNHYKEYTIEDDHIGRWMVMDKGDVDSDGDIDLILGSFLYGSSASDTLKSVWQAESRNVVVMKNSLYQQ